MARPQPPVLFGRRMKLTDKHANGETYDLKSGRVIFQIVVSRDGEGSGAWFDSLLYVDGRSVECRTSRSLDAALGNLIRMRNRLVKSLTPERG